MTMYDWEYQSYEFLKPLTSLHQGERESIMAIQVREDSIWISYGRTHGKGDGYEMVSGNNNDGTSNRVYVPRLLVKEKPRVLIF